MTLYMLKKCKNVICCLLKSNPEIHAAVPPKKRVKTKE